MLFDLITNHDPSLEIERAEENLKRKLNYKEYEYLVKKFNITVSKTFKTFKTDY